MTLPDGNPFAHPSSLPFALPPFADVREDHYRPAFEAGMAAQRAEVDALTATGEAPTFENTVEAMERCGQLLNRVSLVFFNLAASSSTPGLQEIEAEFAPRLAAHHDAIFLNPELYTRLDDVFERRHELALDPEQLRLLERYHTDFIRAGAALAAADQQRLREINQELSSLGAAFESKLLAATNEAAVYVETAAELDGLSAGEIEAAGQAALARGHDSGYLLTLILSTSQPALVGLRNRALRQRLHQASVSRGMTGGEHDTRETLTHIVALRAERAELLGYPSHAAYVIEDETAGTVDAVATMLGALVGPAVENAQREATELQQALLADGESGPLQPWDWPYYADQIKKTRFDVDTAALRPYFELGRVVEDGIFHAAHELYGLSFTLRPDLLGYDPDVQVYQVDDSAGVVSGLFIADWYTRDAKRGGAWMSTFVDQSTLLDQHPVTVINLNIPRPPDGEPTLLSLDEVTTVFHEFGHVLHGLLSDVRYPRQSGTTVPRDFVEFPSQVNEMWAWWPQVIERYAVHHRTGVPLPRETLDRLLASRSSGEGFATTEYLAATLLDLEWHRLGAAEASRAAGTLETVEAFEQAALERHGIAVETVPPRYRTAYFAHIFAGGYSAGYYSYIWSEVLDADLVEWFREHGGLLRRNGEIFRRELLSRGGSRDPMEAFAAVRGRGPRVEPLLERRALTPVG